MDRPAMKMSLYNMTFATSMAKQRVENVLELAKKMTEDPDKERRLEKHECIPCFYSRGIAGQGFTSQPCGICHEDQQYSSTATSALCRPCAKANKLCSRCGGDIDMKEKRRNWPKENQS